MPTPKPHRVSVNNINWLIAVEHRTIAYFEEQYEFYVKDLKRSNYHDSWTQAYLNQLGKNLQLHRNRLYFYEGVAASLTL